MGSRNPFNIQGYQPPKQSATKPAPQPAPQPVQQWQQPVQQPAQQPAQQWQQLQQAQYPYQGMPQMQMPVNTPESPQKPEQAWAGKSLPQQQKTRQEQTTAAEQDEDKTNLFNKRIQAVEVIIDEYGRERGDIARIFELGRDCLFVREIKTMHTRVIAKYAPRSTRIDIYKSTDLRSGNVVGSAVVGGLLFGGMGAVVGAIAGSKQKPFWIVEIDDGEKTRLFKLKDDADKTTLERYVAKRCR